MVRARAKWISASSSMLCTAFIGVGIHGAPMTKGQEIQTIIEAKMMPRNKSGSAKSSDSIVLIAN